MQQLEYGSIVLSTFKSLLVGFEDATGCSSQCETQELTPDGWEEYEEGLVRISNVGSTLVPSTARGPLRITAMELCFRMT